MKPANLKFKLINQHRVVKIRLSTWNHCYPYPYSWIYSSFLRSELHHNIKWSIK
jgi:hypothetical protein